MLQQGHFDEIYKIVDYLETVNQNDALTGEIKTRFSKFIRSKSFLEKLLVEIKSKGRHNRDDISLLCQKLKKFIIKPLIDELINENNTVNRKLYLSILKTLDKDVTEEACKRLHDNEWFVVRNMIYLIRECGDENCTEHIKPFCSHQNIKVRYEAMKTLFHFHHPEGVEYLKKTILNKDKNIRNMGINFAGIHKVNEMEGNKT